MYHKSEIMFHAPPLHHHQAFIHDKESGKIAASQRGNNFSAKLFQRKVHITSKETEQESISELFTNTRRDIILLFGYSMGDTRYKNNHLDNNKIISHRYCHIYLQYGEQM